MKGQTKTFRRLLRKCVINVSRISSKKARKALSTNENLVKTVHREYLKKGKTYVLELYGIKQPKLQLPPSMPKGAADKIASYEDTREQNGMIIITLKNGFVFELTRTKCQAVVNVKEAIAVMRTVESV